jgi:hypothetical protein
LRYTNPIDLVDATRASPSPAHSSRQIALFETLVAPWALPPNA